MDPLPVGEQVLRDGGVGDPLTIPPGLDLLRASLARRRGSQDQRPPLGLERPGEELGRRGRAPIHQEHDRKVMAPRPPGAVDHVVAALTANGDDTAIVEKVVREIDRGLGRAPGRPGNAAVAPAAAGLTLRGNPLVAATRAAPRAAEPRMIDMSVRWAFIQL